MSHPMSLCLWSACMADVLNVSTFTMLVSCGQGRWSVGWAVLRARADFVLSAQYLAQWGSWAVSGLQNAAKSYSINIRCFMLMLWRRYYCKHREDYPLNISVCVSLAYLFFIMISDISESRKAICKPMTKTKMVLENDSLWRLILI